MKPLWWIYNLFLTPALILASPSYLTRMRKRGQAGYRWRERFGCFDDEVKSRLGQAEKPVWIHAVSVGEVIMAEVLIRELRKLRPQQAVVLSTTTITGRRLAEKITDDHFTVIFHTVDLWWCVKRAFDLIDPSLLILVEQELWPNQLVYARRNAVPVWVVNARLSDRSRRRFKRFRSILRPFLGMLGFIGVQSEQDIKRFTECGFPPHKLFHIGSMKYDVVPESDSAKQDQLEEFIAGLGWSDKDLIILCGSTHHPEEEMLLRVCLELEQETGVKIRVILVPRHAERAVSLKKIGSDTGRACVLKSEVEMQESTVVPDVLVVDTTGELSSLYGVADINIIGKSFYGIGGQNFLEAARFPHPIVLGPEMSNFRDAVEHFRSRRALVQVSDETELLAELKNLACNEQLRSEIGERAREVMAVKRGAAKIQAKIVADYLDSQI